MSVLVTCTFDLKNATRAQYEQAYADLKAIGLSKTIVSDGGSKIVAPTTMTMGSFEGQSVTAVRDAVRDRVRAAFSSRHFSSEIFVTAAKNWAWGASNTP